MLKTIIISLMLYLLLSFSCFLVIDTHEVIFLSMSSDYDISTGIQVPPFPGRRALAEELLKNTPMNDIFSSLYFVETLYSVFGVARVSSLKNSYEIATRIADDFIARGYPLNRVDGQGCDSIRNAIVWKDKIAVRYFLDKGYDLPNDLEKSPLCRKSVAELLELYIPEMIDELSQGGAASEAAHPKPATP